MAAHWRIAAAWSFEIVRGIRERCGPDFTLGLRLSPERFGLKLGEMRDVAQRLMHEAQVDFIDLSLWDAFKTPNEAEYAARPLLDWFMDLQRGNVRLGAAGKILTTATATQVPGTRSRFCPARPRGNPASRFSAAGPVQIRNSSRWRCR